MSEVYNSYILEARELCIVSILECILAKISLRHASKRREAIEKWKGRICLKSRKKLEKNAEFSANCFPTNASNRIFHVQSEPKTYIVDTIGRTCKCKMDCLAVMQL